MSRALAAFATSAALSAGAWLAHRALVRDYEAVYLTGYHDALAATEKAAGGLREH